MRPQGIFYDYGSCLRTHCMRPYMKETSSPPSPFFEETGVNLFGINMFRKECLQSLVPLPLIFGLPPFKGGLGRVSLDLSP